MSTQVLDYYLFIDLFPQKEVIVLVHSINMHANPNCTLFLKRAIDSSVQQDLTCFCRILFDTCRLVQQENELQNNSLMSCCAIVDWHYGIRQLAPVKKTAIYQKHPQTLSTGEKIPRYKDHPQKSVKISSFFTFDPTRMRSI